jgi:hypothetical protein
MKKYDKGWVACFRILCECENFLHNSGSSEDLFAREKSLDAMERILKMVGRLR